jgi:peptidoglycan/xylan/chitin deacetylase (PgdA/CDA1 family)
LASLCDAVKQQHVEDRTAVVTFDDGYADNLSDAAPLLEAYGVPATVFVVAGDLATGTPFWWDELANLLLQPGELPPTLAVHVDGHLHEWELGPAAAYGFSDVDAHKEWRAWQPPHQPRHAAYRALWELLQRLDTSRRLALLREINDLLTPTARTEGLPRRLSGGDLRVLARRPGIEVGAHTLSHPTLADLSRDEQHREIAEGRSRLEDELGVDIRFFAYPFGAASNFTADTVSVVREQGFDAACTTLAQPVTDDTDLFRLPRMQVPDCNGDEFARWLTESIGQTGSGDGLR